MRLTWARRRPDQQVNLNHPGSDGSSVLSEGCRDGLDLRGTGRFWLASAGGGREMRIWDSATGTARHTLTGHTGRVSALVVAPEGSWLTSAGDDRTVRIWDPATGTARHPLTGHSRQTRALLIAPDGSWLACTGDDGEIRIWDPTTSEPRTSLHVAGRLLHLVLLTSTTIAGGGERGPYFLALRHGSQSK
jgi:WD40 repeat protein